MALLRIIQTIDNDAWKLTFINDPNELSDTDRKKMRQFGEPEIQVGGEFAYGEGSTFELPEKSVKIRSEFPFVQIFDAKDEDSDFYSNTQYKVIAYRDTIKDRFETALTELREISDTFTGENSTTY